jgi:G3E family GTPase
VTPAGLAQGPGGYGVSGTPDRAVPLTLLTGFLGAGKTTLVNHVLGGGLGIPVGVLVNDFGALNIDRALIAGESEGVLSLENGCICCTLRGDLVASVMRLLDRPNPPQRVLLEASGIADPAPVVGTFMAPAFRDRLRLDGVVCVVDAEQALATPAVEALQLRQIGFSDLVVLNKADLAGPARVAALADRIRREFSAARLIEAVRCAVPAEVLFSLAKLAPGARGSPAQSREPAGMAHGGDFESCSLELDGAFSADALHELPRRLPPSIYRAKGVLRVAGRRGGPDRRGILQVVGRRADLVADRPWRPEDGASRLVFIGAAGTMPAGQIEALARRCLADVNNSGE